MKLLGRIKGVDGRCFSLFGGGRIREDLSEEEQVLY